MNNLVEIILKNYNNSYILVEEENFNFSNRVYRSYYNLKDGKIHIKIISNQNFKNIYNYFLLQYKILFFNNGYFYEIEEYKEDNKIINIKEKYCDLDIYISNNKYIKNYRILKLKDILNPKSIKKFKEIEEKNSLLFNAFYYLHSEKYKDILCDHRFIILSQVAEGYIENSKHNLKLKEKSFLQRILIYIKIFRKYDKLSKSNVLEILNENPKKLARKIKNSRNMYSHYIRKSEILKEDEYIYAFSILELGFRLLIIEDIGCVIKINEEIEENFCSIHDWILSNKYTNLDINKYKSNAYKIALINKK